MGDMGSFELIFGGVLTHLMVSTLIFAALHEDVVKENYLHSLWIFGLPVLNIIVGFQMLGIVKDSYQRTCERLENKIEDITDDKNRIEQYWKYRYEYLEKSKFRKVGVGDVFVIPDTDNWKKETRGKKCVITSITENGVNHTVEGRQSETWHTKWELLKEMVFLSNEPIKPFENVY